MQSQNFQSSAKSLISKYNSWRIMKLVQKLKTLNGSNLVQIVDHRIVGVVEFLFFMLHYNVSFLFLYGWHEGTEIIVYSVSYLLTYLPIWWYLSYGIILMRSLEMCLLPLWRTEHLSVTFLKEYSCMLATIITMWLL